MRLVVDIHLCSVLIVSWPGLIGCCFFYPLCFQGVEMCYGFLARRLLCASRSNRGFVPDLSEMKKLVAKRQATRRMKDD
jgi:hypothetical protein